MQNIEAIIFDLGGVILDIDYNLTQKAFENEGVKNFDEMYSQVKADKLFSNLETGHVSEQDFYKEFNNCTGLNFSNAQICNAWNAMLLSFRENSLLFLDQIKLKYKIFLLSNTNQIRYDLFNKIYNEKIRNKAFDDFFDKAYYSFEIGLRKPDAACYELVLESNSLNPGNTLFIDDSEQNIVAANNLGIQTIWLKPGLRIENLGL
ncbi:MAG: HAD family phosphatase [Ginsengibacter sp.]